MQDEEDVESTCKACGDLTLYTPQELREHRRLTHKVDLKFIILVLTGEDDFTNVTRRSALDFNFFFTKADFKTP